MMDSMGSTSGSSRHPRDWTASSQLNMTNAWGSRQGAAAQSDSSKKAHRTCLDENLSQYSGLHAALDKKVKDSRATLDMLKKRMDSLNSSIHESKRSLANLEEAHRAKDAPLHLCGWRQEQRNKRPTREHIRDALETNLEVEKETLMNCKTHLRESIKKTEATIQGLSEMLRDIQEDAADKHQAKEIDEMCLRTTHKNWQANVESRSPKKSLPPVADAVMEHDHGSNETGRQSDAKRKNQRAIEKERAAQALREESARVIDRCQRQADVARKNTEKAMQDRIKENQGMRKQLEAAIRDTSGKLDHMNQTTRSTSMKLRSLEEPTKLNSTREGWRVARPDRECISDPVSTRLVEHQSSLLRTAKELSKRREIEKFTIDDLQQNQDQLKADLRDKTEALRIDLNCLHHEVVYRGGRCVLAPDGQKLQRAMKIDPDFTPTGGMTGALSAR